uniref:Uncharacterized protein n=1 Tax=Molossus molossus TaxID=27622 RepID=A0A7J8HGV2_MOLMO|nr:hypothetical protein HJG59_010961 [Molossus molossus]
MDGRTKAEDSASVSMMSSAHDRPEAVSGWQKAAPPSVGESRHQAAATAASRANLSVQWLHWDAGASKHRFEQQSELVDGEASEEGLEAEAEPEPRGVLTRPHLFRSQVTSASPCGRICSLDPDEDGGEWWARGGWLPTGSQSGTTEGGRALREGSLQKVLFVRQEEGIPYCKEDDITCVRSSTNSKTCPSGVTEEMLKNFLPLLFLLFVLILPPGHFFH